MKITYLEHSGFTIEHEDVVMIFDYYKGRLPDIPAEKKVYVFASHGHYDHFKRKIFRWSDAYENVKYILSSDITDRGPKGRTIYLEPRKEIELDGMKIRTLRSTDEGVAFFVRFKEMTIFHAGDLNWWHWEDESEAYNEMMRRNYQYKIGKIEGERIDAAFLPLDLRQGEQFFWGMDYFMRHTDTSHVFPMHMWGRYEAYERLMERPESEGYRQKVMHITRTQQVFELEERKE